MILTDEEMFALLKCRYAGRYDNLGDKDRVRATPTEALEEQRASSKKTSRESFLRLQRRGLTEGMPMRLTDKGRAALAEGLRSQAANPKEEP